jgi:DNA polymerase-3 subunit epsilon/CBS domain-containing protein
MRLLTAARSSAATPLVSLTAIAFDSEATALDVTHGRIIEMAAVPLFNGILKPEEGFSTFVAAGVAVPAESTRIHGITADMLAGAPEFREAWRALARYCLGHAWVGYSIEFDLALLEHEHVRSSMAWKPPDILDVQQLVALLNPTLPDRALETVAGWLGIEVKDRHRAAGDAVLTGKVLLALVPMLRERGIRTLGEAQHACALVADHMGQSGLARQVPERRIEALSRADSFPYRHRVEDMMSAPPLKIEGKAKASEALAQMMERKVSSLFVTGSKGLGILTERDLLRALHDRGDKVLNTPASALASFPLQTVRSDDLLYVALGRMRRGRIRHLGVVDGSGAVVGAISQRDLIRQRADEALALSGALDEAASIAELASVWRKLADAARALLAEDVDARDIAAIISGEVCALTARAARMAEAEAAARPKDVDFAVMVLGSGGRGESLLALDQDNALVFSAPDPKAAETWLLPVARRMNDILDEVGVPRCKGGVMAGNAVWRKSTSDWRVQVSHWINRTDPQDIMNADIFFDCLSVHGTAALVDDLRHDAIAAASASPAFLKLMSLSASQMEKATNWLGQFSTDEKGRVDLKKSGIMPIFSAARVLALRYQIHGRSTRDRLQALRGNPDVPQQTLEAVLEAHGLILGVILQQQLDDIAAGVAPSNRVDPKTLSTLQRDRLKWALKQVLSVPDLVGTPI